MPTRLADGLGHESALSRKGIRPKKWFPRIRSHERISATIWARYYINCLLCHVKKLSRKDQEGIKNIFERGRVRMFYPSISMAYQPLRKNNLPSCLERSVLNNFLERSKNLITLSRNFTFSAKREFKGSDIAVLPGQFDNLGCHFHKFGKIRLRL